MRIGFCGAQGTGKSTLLKGMFGWPELNGHAFISGLTRFQVKDKGININQQGNFEGQKTLTRTMCWHLKTLPNLVVDRTLIDIYAYTVYMRDHGNLTNQDLNYIRNRARTAQRLFDIVFYIRPEFEVKEDDYRSADPSFAIEVAAIMERTINEEILGETTVVVVSGEIENRLGIIKAQLEEHGNKN